MFISSNTIVLESDNDLQDVIDRYNLSITDVNDIADSLWTNYGLIVIDRRDNSEYTQCNAQSSPDFCSEDMTLEEMNERAEARKIYQ